MEVRDDSMLPTLRPGDRLLVDRGAYRHEAPSIGDIVVLVDPQQPERWLVKRVAGVGPGRFWRSGTGLVTTESPEAGAPIDLPQESVYVTGDAPGSRDSRMFGPVPWTALVGRAYRCYAPAGRERDLL